jgi:glycosyltransferase involved in cell wall biosynthesis
VADVFVLPSLYEGFGLPVLEAMACGTPVVAANAASLPEVVGDAGLLVDPRSPEAIAEAIAQVLEDPALASDLRERGFQRARAFTWEQNALRTLEVYHRVLENSA